MRYQLNKAQARQVRRRLKEKMGKRNLRQIAQRLRLPLSHVWRIQQDDENAAIDSRLLRYLGFEVRMAITAKPRKRAAHA